MDLKQLKQLINGKNERVIFVEDGEPTLVVMPFGEYKKITSNGYVSEDFSITDDEEEMEEMNGLDQDWQNPFESSDFAEFFSKQQVEDEEKPEEKIKPESRGEVKTEKKSAEPMSQKASEAMADEKNELTLEDLPF